MKVWFAIIEVVITILCVSVGWMVLEMEPKLQMSAIVSLFAVIALFWTLFSALMWMLWGDV